MYQAKTKSGKPMIYKTSKLPVYRISVDRRIKNIVKELFRSNRSNNTNTSIPLPQLPMGY